MIVLYTVLVFLINGAVSLGYHLAWFTLDLPLAKFLLFLLRMIAQSFLPSLS